MFFPHLTSPLKGEEIFTGKLLKGREPLEFQFSSEKD
jgi:hypothetical protein